MKSQEERQSILLQRSLDESVDLSMLLKTNGLTYDDLRYNDDAECNKKDYPPVESLDDLSIAEDSIPAVSFFSGAGGLDIGFRYAGFNNIIGIEKTLLFCNTLRLNNPDQIIIGPPDYDGDISNREIIAQILIDNGVTESFNGVFHGGPPCQSFSIAANQRFNKDGAHFKRIGFADNEKGLLIFDYIWFILKFRPLAFLIENVSGIVECDPDGKITHALNQLRNAGYSIPEPRVIDAAHLGVPQHRKRWIVMGTRGDTPISFPDIQPDETPCGSIFSKELAGVANHMTRSHKAESVIRYAKLKFGGRDHLGRVDRLDPNKPSKTIIAGGVKGGGRSHLHPFIPRTLSVRECARLQTFPDNYIFSGSTARQFTQVGNAVPPLMAYKLALQIRKAIYSDYHANLPSNR